MLPVELFPFMESQNNALKAAGVTLDLTFLNQALLFRALSAPIRLLILRFLVESEFPPSVTNVACHCAVSVPTASKHLAMLESAGLITRKRHKDRPDMLCEIHPNVVKTNVRSAIASVLGTE